MASGPHVLSGNRFRDLDVDFHTEPSNKKKRKKTNYTNIDLNPFIPTFSSNPNPKFIVIAPTDSEKPFSAFSVFLLKKAIDGISTGYEYITQLRDGNLLILVKSLKIAEIFLSRKTLSNLCPIKVSLHTNLNASKGTVYAPYLTNVPEDEIIKEMNAQGVTEVYKFMKKNEGISTPTGLILFTFDLFRPPSTVNIGWYNCKVVEYFPTPMRCQNCQLLGHTAKRCKNPSACVNCNMLPVDPHTCTHTYCANCAEEHPASSKICKSFLKAKEILKIKTTRKCTMLEAKQAYKELNPELPSTQTYANVANIALQAKPISTINNPVTNVNKSTPTHSSVQVHIEQPSHTEKQPTSTNNKKDSSKIQPSNEFLNSTSLSNTPPKSTSQQISLPGTSSLHQQRNSPIPVNNTISTQIPPNIPPRYTDPTAINFNSPLSQITQSLVDNNNYYINSIENDDDSI